jgi:paraquat-inducible protein B
MMCRRKVFPTYRSKTSTEDSNTSHSFSKKMSSFTDLKKKKNTWPETLKQQEKILQVAKSNHSTQVFGVGDTGCSSILASLPVSSCKP